MGNIPIQIQNRIWDEKYQIFTTRSFTAQREPLNHPHLLITTACCFVALSCCLNTNIYVNICETVMSPCLHTLLITLSSFCLQVGTVPRLGVRSLVTCNMKLSPGLAGAQFSIAKPHETRNIAGVLQKETDRTGSCLEANKADAWPLINTKEPEAAESGANC